MSDEILRNSYGVRIGAISRKKGWDSGFMNHARAKTVKK